jgi:hypothetical protein
MTVRADEPFSVTWSNENVRSSIAGVLRNPDTRDNMSLTARTT